MTTLWWARLRAHPIRTLLVAACGAFVSLLMWVAVAVAASAAAGVPDPTSSGLFWSVALTPGVALAALLLTTPAVAFTHQLVQLGAREREATMRTYLVVGASMEDLRRLAALEIAAPGALGAMGGWPLLLLLRAGLVSAAHGIEGGYELVLVPAVAWSPLGVAGGTVAISSLVGALFAVIARRGLRAEVGDGVRPRRRPPGPWGWVVLGIACVLFAGATAWPGPLLAMAAVVAGVAGMLMVAPWAAYHVGRVLGRRTSEPALLLAARRLEADPRTIGRAASVIGVVGMVVGALGELIDTLLTGDAQYGLYYWAPLGMVGMAVIVALVVTLASIVVASVENLARHAPAISTLHAGGLSGRIQTRSRQYEVLLVSVPLGLLGCVLVLAMLTLVAPLSWVAAALTLVGLVVVTAGLSLVAVRLTAPWARRAMSPVNLRTE